MAEMLQDLVSNHHAEDTVLAQIIQAQWPCAEAVILQTIFIIPTADQNVYAMLTVRSIGPVIIGSVPILVLVLAGKMHFVESSCIHQCAAVHLDFMVIHMSAVVKFI